MDTANTSLVWITLIGSLTTIITLVLTHLLTNRHVKTQSGKIDQVHTLVNDRLDRALEDNRQLKDALGNVQERLARMVVEKKEREK